MSNKFNNYIYTTIDPPSKDIYLFIVCLLLMYFIAEVIDRALNELT